MRATISRAEVFALCRSLGADPDDVRDITVTPMEVTVTTFLRNANGEKYFDEAADDAATHRHVIPIVGERDTDTVTMRHPNLPGRVINVPARAVGQHAVAGWEVATGESAPVAPAEPEPDKQPEAPAPGEETPRGRRKSKESD